MSKATILYVEGPKGAGKDFTIANLTKDLTLRGVKFKVVREPGGDDSNVESAPMAHAIRALIKSDTARTRECEALLFQAARVELFKKEIEPLLEEDILIIVNRSIFSTLVTQHALHGVEFVREVHLATASDYIADSTIWLMPPLDVLKERRTQRNGNFDIVNPEDNIDSEYKAYAYIYQSMTTIGEQNITKRHALVQSTEAPEVLDAILKELHEVNPKIWETT